MLLNCTTYSYWERLERAALYPHVMTFMFFYSQVGFFPKAYVKHATVLKLNI